MDLKELKNKLGILLKQLLDDSVISAEKAQEISVAFEDLCNQTIDTNDLKNLLIKFTDNYPELEPYKKQILVDQIDTTDIKNVREALKKIATNN